MNARLYAVQGNDSGTDRNGDLVIDIARLNKSFGRNKVLKNINLRLSWSFLPCILATDSNSEHEKVTNYVHIRCFQLYRQVSHNLCLL